VDYVGPNNERFRFADDGGFSFVGADGISRPGTFTVEDSVLVALLGNGEAFGSWTVSADFKRLIDERGNEFTTR
jgi:hypothetical protein